MENAYEKIFQKIYHYFLFYSFDYWSFVYCTIMYHSFKTPKIEKKSHTLYGFLLTNKNQEPLSVTATIDFKTATYTFHNRETSIQGKITVSYAQKEIYTTDFYSHNLERKYISIEDISKQKSVATVFSVCNTFYYGL